MTMTICRDQDVRLTARSVLERTLGAAAAVIEIDMLPSAEGHEIYRLSAANGTVHVAGSSPVAICRGVYSYLREAGLGMVCWSGQRIDLPSTLPDAASRTVRCPYRLVQYYNPCTFGYSTPFWDWPRWERELDWMALHGITMPLALDGQEAIWQRVWQGFGITQAELDRYFTGPGYLPWHRMGNINYFEGPLPQAWIDGKRVLQGQILDRMRALGMTPIVPAFSGFVPEAFLRIRPEARAITGIWTPQMPRQSKTLILDPEQGDLYREIGARFIAEYTAEFGPCDHYLADTFNEMRVPVGENPGADLARFARSVFESMRAGNPDAVWVMQGWLFHNMPEFWTDATIAAFLSGVPDDRMLILDYANDFGCKDRDGDPTALNKWRNHGAFFGKQWVNGMIHTFGGNDTVKGNLPQMAAQAAAVLASPDRGQLVGWSLNPEGIDNNEVVYELLTDIGWRDGAIDMAAWIPAYCEARYGANPPAMARAWALLLDSAYGWHATDPTWNSRHAWQTRPSLDPKPLGVDASPAYDAAVEAFLACADMLGDQPLYRHDLIELVAQAVGNRIDAELIAACAAHRGGDTAIRDHRAARALAMLDRVDAILALRPERRLENFIADAERWADGADEKAYYDRNARRLITFWGWPELNDYASRAWSGLIRDYYAPRWRAFFDGLRSGVAADLDVWEESWLLAPYRPSAAAPVADLIQTARQMLDESAGWHRPAGD